MGCRHKAHTKFWTYRSWPALFLGLTIAVVASQVIGVGSAQAQSELSASRILDSYSFNSCRTYEYSNPGPPYNGRISSFHKCRITQDGNDSHHSAVCIPFDQLVLDANTGHETATRNFYFISSFSPITETISDAKNLADTSYTTNVSCPKPEGSNAVYPYYSGFTIDCQRPDTDFTGPNLGGLLDTTPNLLGICSLKARFELAVAAFVEPTGYDQREGWRQLTDCAKKTAYVGPLAWEAWHCRVSFYTGRSAGSIPITRDVCLDDISLLDSNYYGFDRDSYHLMVKLTTLPNFTPKISCITFDNDDRHRQLYAHCANLERAEVGIVNALLAGKCQFQEFTAPLSQPTDPSQPSSPRSIDCDNPGNCPSFQEVIKQCEDDDGSCGFLATVNSFLSWMAYLVVPIVTIVIIIGAVQLSLAGDNPEGTKKAKMRITQAIVALVCYALLWSVLRWLI